MPRKVSTHADMVELVFKDLMSRGVQAGCLRLGSAPVEEGIAKWQAYLAATAPAAAAKK